MPPRFFICISFRMALSVSEFPVSTGRARRRRSINVCWVRGAHWCGVRTPSHVRRGSGAHRWRGSGHCFFPCQSFKLDCSFIKRGRSGQEIPRPGPHGSISFSGRKHPIDRAESPPTVSAGVPAPCRLLHSSQHPRENFYEGDDCGPERLQDFPKVTQPIRGGAGIRTDSTPECALSHSAQLPLLEGHIVPIRGCKRPPKLSLLENRPRGPRHEPRI